MNKVWLMVAIMTMCLAGCGAPQESSETTVQRLYEKVVMLEADLEKARQLAADCQPGQEMTP